MSSIGTSAPRLLESWKAIAAYLHRNVRTCQLWEREHNLPVHRLDGSPKARVFAYPEELDRWREEKLHERETPLRPRPRKLAIIGAGILAAAALLILLKIVPKRSSAPGPAAGVPSVAVLYFQNARSDADLDEWREWLSSLMTVRLRQSRFIRVVDDGQLYAVLERSGLLDKTAYSPDEIEKIASSVAATHLITGSFSRAGDRFRIEAALVRAAVAEPAVPEIAEGSGEESILGLVDALAERMKSRLGLPPGQSAADTGRDLTQVLTRSPEALKLYLEGNRFNERGPADQARDRYEKAIAIDPDFAMAHVGLGQVHWYLGNATKCVQSFSKAFALRDRVSERERHFIEGQYYHYSSERTWDKALDAYAKLAALYPWDIFAGEELAYLLFKMDEWDKVIERIEILRRFRTESTATYQILAFACMSVGEPQKAKDALESYLAGISDNEMIRAYLVYVCCVLGEMDRAKALLEGCGLEDSNSAAARIIYLLNSGDHAALDAVLDQVAAGPVRFVEQNFRRAALVSQGKLAEARALLDSQFEATKGQSIGGTAVGYAGLLEKSGDLSRALVLCDAGLERSRKTGYGLVECRALYRRGTVLARQGRTEEALRTAEELRQVVERGAARKWARYYEALLGLILLLKNDPGTAQVHFRSALSMTGHADGWLGNFRAEFLEHLAQAHEMAGQWDQAKKAYEDISLIRRAVWFDPSNVLVLARSHYNLGRVLERLGDRERAAAKYRHFLDL